MGRAAAVAMGGFLSLVCGFSCGAAKGSSSPSPAPQLPLPDDSQAALGPRPSWGIDVAEGFLRPCQVLASGEGVVELACGEHQLAEFRNAPERESRGAVAPDIEGESSNADTLPALMRILSARFGALKETRGKATLDSQELQVSEFSSDKSSGGGVSGLAVFVSNVQGQFWGLVCYRKGREANLSYCRDAISTAARSGGLGFVEARALETSESPTMSLGGGHLKVPRDCQLVGGRKIRCETGELSWSVDVTRKAEDIRLETLKALEGSAHHGSVAFHSEARACTLFGSAADCVLVSLHNQAKAEWLTLVLLTGGNQEKLVVCAAPAQISAALPVPCDQAIVLPPR